MIGSYYEPATYQTAHHGGSGWPVPAVAVAYRHHEGRTTARVEITSDQFPGLEPHQMEAKAVALLRRAAPLV